MPFASNQGVRIHYRVEGAGPPLILQHGYTLDLLTWHELGYVDVLKGRYRLIMLDARGHHLSDKPHAPEAYRSERFVGDILAVLDALCIERAHYFGYSMGGLIGYAMAHHAPERMGAMILGGASPFPVPQDVPDPFLPVLAQGARGLLSFYEGCLTPELEARLLASDMEALIALRRTRYATPGFVASLPHMRMPSLLLCGDQDGPHAEMRDAAARMPAARFVSLPGLAHVPALWARNTVLAHVMPFLEGRVP